MVRTTLVSGPIGEAMSNATHVHLRSATSVYDGCRLHRDPAKFIRDPGLHARVEKRLSSPFRQSLVTLLRTTATAA
jgi:hypothetical protein